MVLTKQEAITEHRKMWNWIADTIKEEKRIKDIRGLKRKYLEQKDLKIISSCFCCEYSNFECEFCPLEWNSNLNEFMCEQKYAEDDGEGLYALCYLEETSWVDQYKLARKIAYLPERD